MTVRRYETPELDEFANLTEALSYQIRKVEAGEVSSTSLTLLGSKYQPNPYVQVAKSDNSLTLEMVSNSFLETKLTPWEESAAVGFGWRKPTKSNPNFWCEAEHGDHRSTAQFLIASLKLVYGLKNDSWFTFGNSPDEHPLLDSKLFWHLRGNSAILCLPGQDLDLSVEGRAR